MIPVNASYTRSISPFLSPPSKFRKIVFILPVIPFQIYGTCNLKDKNRNVVFPVIIFQIRGAYKEILKEIPTIFPVTTFQIQGVYKVYAARRCVEVLSLPFRFKVFTTHIRKLDTRTNLSPPFSRH